MFFIEADQSVLGFAGTFGGISAETWTMDDVFFSIFVLKKQIVRSRLTETCNYIRTLFSSDPILLLGDGKRCTFFDVSGQMESMAIYVLYWLDQNAV